MRSKISRKLVFYFSITLVIFALIIGFTFSSMFRQSTRDQARIDLEMRAQTIAQSVAIYLNDTNQNNSVHMMGGGMGGHGMRNRNLSLYLDSLEATTMGEVWVVDKNMKSIDRSHNSGTLSIDELPTDSENLISQALSGMKVYSDGFSDHLNAQSLTVGVPVYDEGVIVGAVLLHAPIAGIDAVIQHGYHVLAIYITAALLLSVAIAYLLSQRFVRPLNIMKDTSQLIAEGNYDVHTDIHQNDEIGELAKSLDDLALQLDLASQERDKLDYMRNEFFADISHELRTPVTVLRGSLETLSQAPMDANSVQLYHDSMLVEITHLQNLINDLLDFSKLNTTDFSLNMETVHLNDIVSDSIRSMRPLTQKKNIQINYTFDNNPNPIFGDYSRIRQMITIILDNAVKFSNESSVIDVGLNASILSITDYGVGIPVEDIPHIFNRFYKDEGTQNTIGNGIGLAIAHQIAKRHDITINVQSIQNTETSFTLDFTQCEKSCNERDELE